MKNKSMVFEIIKKEIRDVIRDKKTLLMMIVVPILLYPIFFGFMLTMQEDMANVEESVYNTIGFTFETDDTMNTIIDEMEIQKQTGTEEELREKLENGEINGYITLNGNEFTIYYTEQDTYGYATLELAYEVLGGYTQAIQSQMLTSEGLIPDEIFNVYTMEVEDVSNRNAYTETMLSMVPSFILMTTTLTAIFSAIDMTAGEKERGTLETLLTFPIKNSDIITGKFIATTLCTIVSAILGFSSMYTVLYYMSGKLETFTGMELLTAQSIILLLIIFAIFSMLVSALAIVVASKAKSFKEAQNSSQPLSFLCLIPMFISIMGIELNTTLALIPFVNVSLLINQIISNSVNMQYFVIMVISNIAFIFILLKAISKLYKSDKILFS